MIHAHIGHSVFGLFIVISVFDSSHHNLNILRTFRMYSICHICIYWNILSSPLSAVILPDVRTLQEPVYVTRLKAGKEKKSQIRTIHWKILRASGNEKGNQKLKRRDTSLPSQQLVLQLVCETLVVLLLLLFLLLLEGRLVEVDVALAATLAHISQLLGL